MFSCHSQFASYYTYNISVIMHSITYHETSLSSNKLKSPFPFFPRSFLLRAESAGYSAVVLTVDSPLMSRRRITRRFAPPVRLANFVSEAEAEANPGRNLELVLQINDWYDDAVTWDDIEWVRKVTALPIVLKGE